jgi:hypothetical protein
MTAFVLALWTLVCPTADGAATPGPVRLWYADADGDGFGDPGATTLGRVQPVGYIHDAGDCDDANAAVHPRAREVCNGMDDDCDPTSDEVGTVSTHGAIYSSIQDAIDAAAPGGTVSLCSGVWFENLVIAKGLVLEGVGPDQSIVDGDGAGSVISMAGHVDVTVRGLTIQHGWTWGAGGGINAPAHSALTVENCVVAEITPT